MANIDSVKLPNGNEYNLQDVVTPRDFTNPNLLINPWFTVNQRGSASYTPNNSYTVDNWKGTFSSGFTVAVNSDGIKVTNTAASGRRILTQIMEFGSLIEGKTVTGSILLKDGTILKGSVVASDTRGTDVKVFDFGVNSELRLTHGANDDYQWFSIVVGNGESFDIRAVKLEIGSTSTLHLDTAPDYTTELLKCRRYFYRINGDVQYLPMVNVSTEATLARGIVTFPTEMISAPNIASGGSMVISAVGTSYVIDSISLSNASKQIANVRFYATGLTAGQYGIIMAMQAGAYLEFDTGL